MRIDFWEVRISEVPKGVIAIDFWEVRISKVPKGMIPPNYVTIFVSQTSTDIKRTSALA